MMTRVSSQDVFAIKEWLAKEPSLPSNFDDFIIEKFIFSCHNSLERTKKCIEEFCTRRTNMPEIFTNRDTTSKKAKEVFNTTCVANYYTDVDEILVHRLDEVNDNFDFYELLKNFMIQGDNWLLHKRPDFMPENQIVIADIKNYSLSMVPKVNIFYFQKFIMFLLESMPIRLKSVHAINCPSFYEYLFSLVKPALPKYICDLIHFHPDHTGLYEYIDKKYLPLEYGGDAESMVEQSNYWVNQIYEKREFFLNDNLWKADLSKKTKNGGVDTTMSGSFRTLTID